jgi:hypothetical protein
MVRCCSMTAETEAAAAQRLLRRLDPYFDVEEWKADLCQHLLPEVSVQPCGAMCDHACCAICDHARDPFFRVQYQCVVRA